MNSAIEQIQAGCDYVLAKIDKRNKKICSVSTGLAWADWEHKIFSPALCALWFASKDEIGNLIFPTGSWTEALASKLGVSNVWVESFIYYCSGQNTYDQAIINMKTGEIEFTAVECEFSPQLESLEGKLAAQHFIKKYPNIMPLPHPGIKLAPEHATSVRKNIIKDLLSIKVSS